LLIRVAIDASGASSGGAVRYLSQICPALAKAAPDTTYYLLNRASQRSLLTELPDNFEWVQIPDNTASLPRRLLWLQVGLPNILKRIHADVLFAASDVSTLRPPCPMVVMVHNFNPFSPHRGEVWSQKQLARMAVHRWLIRPTALKAARVVFVSQWSRQEMIPQLGIPADRTAVIYHGVDPGFTPSKESATAKQSARFILVVSEVLEHKNLHRAVAAYGNLAQHTNEQLNLVIAGTVTSHPLKRALEATLSNQGLLGQVTFTGFLSKEDLADLYRQAELLVFPSLVETFGLPLIEAMASGLPVVTSNAAAMPEICRDAAGYFDPLDVASITQAMQSVLTDTALQQRLIQAGLERAATFSWETAAKSLLHNLEVARSGKLAN
jgi:glycosyltransferase involved in cell wall biosynthesis